MQAGGIALWRGRGCIGCPAGNIGGDADTATVAGLGLVRAFFRGLAGNDYPLVRVVDNGMLGGLVEVKVGTDLHAHAIGAGNGAEHGPDFLGQTGLEHGLLPGGQVSGAAVLVAVGQHPATLVGDGHGTGLQPRHRRGNQLADGPGLGGANDVVLQAHHHRGLGLFRLALEQAPFGQHQQHPCGADAVKRGDGALQFTLQSPQLRHVLGKTGLPHGVGLVENFIAHGAGRRQIVRRQGHAHLLHLLARHQDGRAARASVIGHAHLVEPGGDFRRFLQVEP